MNCSFPEHCAALPYLSEVIGYSGPIYMTQPTKSIVPILLEELRKMNVELTGESNFFSTQAIKNCIKKVTAVNLHETIKVDNDLEIRAYYAGHVLGAAMFWIKVGSQTVVYTGDFNMNPDRHLGPAWIDKCQPDLLITECIFASKSRSTNKCRDRDFLKKVHDCMSRGGKVLIPVFILGRAQELCILLDSYWERMKFPFPIYFGVDSFTEKANSYYKMYKSWTNEKWGKHFAGENMFEFNHIKPFDKSCIDKPGPMVVLATAGMLHSGISLYIFKKWASDERNLLILPDYCPPGTVGHQLLSGAKQIKVTNQQIIDVKLNVEYMSFSATTDAKGIMQLIRNCEPKNVMLVHGKIDSLLQLRKNIGNQYNIVCLCPINGEACALSTPIKFPSNFETCLLAKLKKFPPTGLSPKNRLMNLLVHVEQKNRIVLTSLYDSPKWPTRNRKCIANIKIYDPEPKLKTEEKVSLIMKEILRDWSLCKRDNNTITVESVEVKVIAEEPDQSEKSISVSWETGDDDIGQYILQILHKIS